MAAQTFGEYCLKCQPRIPNIEENCIHIPVCKKLWNAAIKSLEGVQTQPTNTQRLAEAAQINHALKSLESNDKRLEFLSDCFAGICRHCGEVTESCYCMRDD